MIIAPFAFCPLSRSFMKQHNRNLMNPFQLFWYNIAEKMKHIPSGLVSLLIRLGKFFIRVVRGAARAFARGTEIFANGDVFTKLSFIIMGLALIIRKQIVKGLLFFATQVLFILFFVQFGWNYLKDLGTLGVNAETEFIDPVTGIIMYNPADNSMLILLYSVFTLVVMLAFIVIWVQNVKACWKADRAHKEGIPLNPFKQEMHSLLDERYHTTLLIAPTIMAFAFVVIPLLFMILIAFTNYDMNHQPPGNLFTWVGLQNFKDIFGESATKSKTFFYLFRWDVIWAISATFLNYILGLVLALMINKKGIKGKKVWRTMFVITIAVPQFVSLLLMSRLFGDSGPVNLILQNLGFAPVPFLTNGTTARIMVIIINLWVGIPYTMLITSGILMNIPAELYESARIDGAGTLRTFFKITMPYMLFVTTPYLITQFVGNFNNFNVIYLLTQGDPKSVWLYQAGETDLLVTWLYKLTVTYQDYNLASVIGILVFIVSASMSLIVYNYSASAKREEEFQ